MLVTSPDFLTGGRLDDQYAASGGNTEPRIHVTQVPTGTRELALIVHDPDAPIPYGFTHLLRYGLAGVSGLAGASTAQRDGLNDFGHRGYDGPMPPEGHGIHHYYFWVYALDKPVLGEPSRLEFLNAYAERIIAQERMVGTYSRV
ncbi:hypothetical protein ARUE_c18740 [Arthrobacter sp. Rue61a]|nr:hypothetical protein ARUE_c18740 [Arthrobacter sp. Rue61a]